MSAARWMPIVVALAAAGLPAGAQDGVRAELVAAYRPEGELLAHWLVDLDGGGVEIVEIGADAAVRVGRLAGGSFVWAEPQPVLPDPEHSLLACADVLDADGVAELVVASRDGVSAYRLAAGGGFAAPAVPLSRRARIEVRAGRPTFAPFVEDINGDGGPDLLLPRGEGCEMWLAEAVPGGPPRYRLLRTVNLAVRGEQAAGATRLSDTLRSEIVFPRLLMEDVNGDGRRDLLEREGRRRAFYLQAPDGSFAEQPIEVDVGIFRDTTPKAEIQPGRTLVATDNQHIQSGDLDGDGIPDHVIAHRRRVWVFLSDEAGPQFTRPRRRRVAEDISGLLLADLDEDGRQDLLIVKVQVPSAASLVLGLISSMSIDVTALGYPTDRSGDFAAEPAWRRELVIEVPAILSLMSEAEAILERFEEILAKLRISTTGRFLAADGTTADDLVMVSEDGGGLEIWRQGGTAAGFFSQRGRYLREILFEEPDPVFDVDRLLTIVSGIFDARTATLTGGVAADGSFRLPDRGTFELRELLARDMDGDGVDEVVAVYGDPGQPDRVAFDVVRWRD